MINIIVLLLVFITLIVISFNKEHFNDLSILTNKMTSLNEKDAIKDIVESVDKSVNEFKAYVNLDLNEIELDSPLLDEYLYTKVIATEKDRNIEDVNTQLPIIVDNDYNTYNHQLKLLINSKKIKQDFILNVLKNKINYLLGTLTSIDELKNQTKK